jgi:hypothetical protein
VEGAEPGGAGGGLPWADGIYVKAGLDKDKAALLVVIAALRDGTKVLQAVRTGSSGCRC